MDNEADEAGHGDNGEDDRRCLHAEELADVADDERVDNRRRGAETGEDAEHGLAVGFAMLVLPQQRPDLIRVDRFDTRATEPFESLSDQSSVEILSELRKCC